MSLRIEIENKYKEALKSKNLDIVNAIRLIKKDHSLQKLGSDMEKFYHSIYNLKTLIK